MRRLARVDWGVINAVYAAELEGGPACFVKVTPRSRGEHRLREEVWAYGRCRRVGVPTPEVLAFDPAPSHFPEPYLITRRIPGENGLRARLSDDDRQAVLRQLGGYLARIHTIALDGFGLLRPVGDGFAGEHPSLWANLVRELDAGWWREPVLHHGLATPAELAALRERFVRDRALFTASRACLVYADSGLKNLVVQGNAVTGLVDMENVVAGEPVNDFDALHYETEADFRAVQEGYGQPELFDAAFTRKLALYRLLFSFPRLAYHHRRGDAAGLAATRRRIQRLEVELGPCQTSPRYQ